MVEPERMCSRHLLGEHNEVHMLIGSLFKKRNISGFLKKRIVEPQSIRARHDAIATEMERRGYNHRSPFPGMPDMAYLGKEADTVVDWVSSYRDLMNRCERCREMAPNKLE